MNNIIRFTRSTDELDDFETRLDAVPPVAWAIAQLIVHNDIGPDVVADAVGFYLASMDADDDDSDD